MIGQENQRSHPPFLTDLVPVRIGRVRNRAGMTLMPADAGRPVAGFFLQNALKLQREDVETPLDIVKILTPRENDFPG